jgi:hypothetical protein
MNRIIKFRSLSIPRGHIQNDELFDGNYYVYFRPVYRKFFECVHLQVAGFEINNLSGLNVPEMPKSDTVL